MYRHEFEIQTVQGLHWQKERGRILATHATHARVACVYTARVACVYTAHVACVYTAVYLPHTRVERHHIPTADAARRSFQRLPDSLPSLGPILAHLSCECCPEACMVGPTRSEACMVYVRLRYMSRGMYGGTNTLEPTRACSQ